jgi:hypothetical protein
MKLLPHAEEMVGNYECGLKAGKPTADQILEKARQYNTSTFHPFIEFRAAYDSIQRDKLFKAMTEFGI